MRKKILLITLVLIFVMGTGVLIAGNMHDKLNGNDNWGLVETPTDVTAEFDEPSDTITICWDPTDDSARTTIDAKKWSFVLYFTAYFDWFEACLDKYGCTSCPYQREVELDYSANKNVYDGTGPNAGKKCIDLTGEKVYGDIVAYLNNELADCINCQSMKCLDSWTADPAMVKGKGLAPGKGPDGNGRMNNLFSDPVVLINYKAWYDLWCMGDCWMMPEPPEPE